MYFSLMTSFLGIDCRPQDAVRLASLHGFAGIDLAQGDLLAMSLSDARSLGKQMKDAGIKPGACGIPPGRIPTTDASWGEAVAVLEHLADVAAEIGFVRATMVLLPFHESKETEEAIQNHVSKLSALLPTLERRGIRLGIEYVSAITRRAPFPLVNHTIFCLKDTLRLVDRVREAGHTNLGLLLDSFHWHCACETRDDLSCLSADQVVAVHICDAPDRHHHEHTVTERGLPGSTGVIDLRAFLEALEKIGYDGPITCEPMAPAIRALGLPTHDDVLEVVSETLRRTAKTASIGVATRSPFV